MKRLGDSEQLKVLLHSFQAILDDPTRIKPEPPEHHDWRDFDADYFHLNGLIRAGRNRSLAVNDPICNVCVEGYELTCDCDCICASIVDDICRAVNKLFTHQNSSVRVNI